MAQTLPLAPVCAHLSPALGRAIMLVAGGRWLWRAKWERRRGRAGDGWQTDAPLHQPEAASESFRLGLVTRAEGRGSGTGVSVPPG